MSIKDIVKTYCPKFMRPLLRLPYRIIKHKLLSCRAMKYLPCYKDDLSREILHDRIEYLKTHDANIFLRRAIKDGWNITPRCAENLRDYRDRVTLINKGLWDKDETIRVNPSGGGGSTLYSQGEIEASLTSIDSTVKGDHHKASSKTRNLSVPQARRHLRNSRIHSLTRSRIQVLPEALLIEQLGDRTIRQL